MIKSIYVGNIPFSMSSQSVQELFEPYGEVYSVKLIYDRVTGRPRGFAFIEMDDVNLPKVISALNGSECEGRNIVVNEAKEARRETSKTN